MVEIIYNKYVRFLKCKRKFWGEQLGVWICVFEYVLTGGKTQEKQNESTSTCPGIHAVIPTTGCHLSILIFVSPKATINQPQSPSYIISLNDIGPFTFQDGNVISSWGQSFLLTTFISSLSANWH